MEKEDTEIRLKKFEFPNESAHQNNQNKHSNNNPTNAEKEEGNNKPIDKTDKNAKKNDDSVVDKYLFFLYALLFIVLVYSDVNITLNNYCYGSMKSLFNLTGVNTSRQVSLNDMIPTIADSVNILSQNNYILQVFIIFYF